MSIDWHWIELISTESWIILGILAFASVSIETYNWWGRSSARKHRRQPLAQDPSAYVAAEADLESIGEDEADEEAEAPTGLSRLGSHLLAWAGGAVVTVGGDLAVDGAWIYAVPFAILVASFFVTKLGSRRSSEMLERQQSRHEAESAATYEDSGGYRYDSSGIGLDDLFDRWIDGQNIPREAVWGFFAALVMVGGVLSLTLLF